VLASQTRRVLAHSFQPRAPPGKKKRRGHPSRYERVHAQGAPSATLLTLAYPPIPPKWAPPPAVRPPPPLAAPQSCCCSQSPASPPRPRAASPTRLAPPSPCLPPRSGPSRTPGVGRARVRRGREATGARRRELTCPHSFFLLAHTRSPPHHAPPLPITPPHSETYQYYSLPFCPPANPKHKADGLGAVSFERETCFDFERAPLPLRIVSYLAVPGEGTEGERRRLAEPRGLLALSVAPWRRQCAV